MNLFWDLGLQAIKIITLVIGILGVMLSLLLLLSPKLTKVVSHIFNRSVDIDKKINCLDRDIRIDHLIYQHNIFSGVCLIFGSAFLLVYLFYRFDAQSLFAVFSSSGDYRTSKEIVIEFMAIIGKLAGIAGILAGSILLFNPGIMKMVEGWLNKWCATQPFVEKLEQTQGDIDSIVYRRPVVFGLIGLVTSVYLTFIAFSNILS